MKKKLLQLVFVFNAVFLSAQTFTSSNLPIVVINTGNQAIPDQPKLAAYMSIIDNGVGVRNHITDPFNDYVGKIGIEVRGSSSAGFPQKSYGFETRNVDGTTKDTMVLGMPAEHDWILYAPYDDKTCIRNVLSYDIANKCGHYATRTKYCEVLLNGQYQGIYVMMEKIKRDKDRVAISKLTPLDNSGDALTGGYIIKIDKTTGSSGAGWYSNYPSPTGSSIYFQYDYPKDVDITPQQQNYIQKYVDTFETVLSSANFADPTTGYRKYMSVNSFIDYFILNEVSKNIDGYKLSTYLHKDKQSAGGKLKMGPVWDYNLAWWNADYCDSYVSTGWLYQFGGLYQGSPCIYGPWQAPFWWAKLLQDPAYTAQLKCRWNELRQTTLSISTLDHFVDSIAGYLNESQIRHFTQWPILGTYTWPNPSPIPSDYAGEIAALKSWILDRITWLDANMPGTCTTVGVNESVMNEKNVSVYPNPFNSSFHLNFYLLHNEQLKIEIRDVLGNVVKNIDQKEFQEGDNNLEIRFADGELKTGMYFLTISSKDKMVVKKLSKTE